MLRRLARAAKRLLLPRRIAWAMRGCKDPIVIVVGANDGKTGDPIFPFLQSHRVTKALLVEPIPYLFKRLEISCAHLANCECVNVAIAQESGTRSIYFIDPAARTHEPRLPEFFEELASFSREYVLRALPPGGEHLLREISVPTLPLRTLVQRAGLSRVDLLQVDTEGHDCDVLKTFPFESMRPRLICFEHSHLTPDQLLEVNALLTHNGYRIERWGKDSVCQRARPPKSGTLESRVHP